MLAMEQQQKEQEQLKHEREAAAGAGNGEVKQRPYHGPATGRIPASPLLKHFCPVTLARNVQRLYRRMLGAGTSSPAGLGAFAVFDRSHIAFLISVASYALYCRAFECVRIVASSRIEGRCR